MRSLLERELKVVAYTDPDDVCLKQMEKTFLAEIEKGMAEIEAREFSSSEQRRSAILTMRQLAYERWRPASNEANNLILANLIEKIASFYFGTTASAPQTGLFLRALKERGYEIRLIHLSAEDAVRYESVSLRDGAFVQTTPEDVAEKGLLLPQRLEDTYLKYADSIEFYDRLGADQPARLAAVWNRHKVASAESGLGEAALSGEVPCEGVLRIENPAAYAHIKEIHDGLCEKLKRMDILWDNCMRSTKVLE